MSLKDTILKQLGKVNGQLRGSVEKGLKVIPGVSQRIEKEYDGMMAELESSVKPYKGKFPSFTQLPEQGRDRGEIVSEMQAMYAHEEEKWKDGFVSGAVYHGDEEHIDFLNQIYTINSQSNPLHVDIWPSIAKFESEIVAMTANMLGKGAQDIRGTLASGGTESILLAMKTYRDWARAQKGITKPEMIVPITAHAAFDKASQYFNIKMVHVPIDGNYCADVDAVQKAITPNTVVIAGSAPSFP